MMDQFTNKIDFLISSDTSLIQPTQTVPEPNRNKNKCNECNKRRKFLDESHQICHVCHEYYKRVALSGNKVIDDFIKYTQTNYANKKGNMIFVPYDRFKNVEFIAEG